MPQASLGIGSQRRRWILGAAALAAILAFLGLNAPALVRLTGKAQRVISGHSEWPEWASVREVGEQADLGCMTYSVVGAEWRSIVDVNPVPARGWVSLFSTSVNELDLPEFAHVPEGTRFSRADGALYRATQGGTISEGVLSLEIEALEGGDVGNADPGSKLSLVNPVAGLSPKATVTSEGVSGGAPGPRLDVLTGEIRYLVVDLEVANRDGESPRRAVVAGLIDSSGEKFAADVAAMRAAVGADPYGVIVAAPGETVRSRLVFRVPHNRRLALCVGDPCGSQLWASMLLDPSFRR